MCRHAITFGICQQGGVIDKEVQTEAHICKNREDMDKGNIQKTFSFYSICECRKYSKVPFLNPTPPPIFPLSTPSLLELTPPPPPHTHTLPQQPHPPLLPAHTQAPSSDALVLKKVPFCNKFWSVFNNLNSVLRKWWKSLSEGESSWAGTADGSIRVELSGGQVWCWTCVFFKKALVGFYVYFWVVGSFWERRFTATGLLTFTLTLSPKAIFDPSNQHKTIKVKIWSTHFKLLNQIMCLII